MSDIRNTLDLLTKLEESTVAGGVAPVSATLGTEKRVQESGPEKAPKVGLAFGDWANSKEEPTAKPKKKEFLKPVKTKKAE